MATYSSPPKVAECSRSELGESVEQNLVAESISLEQLEQNVKAAHFLSKS